jgi:hypothetical protein
MFNQSVVNGVGKTGSIVATVANEDFPLAHCSIALFAQQ